MLTYQSIYKRNTNSFFKNLVVSVLYKKERLDNCCNDKQMLLFNENSINYILITSKTYFNITTTKNTKLNIFRTVESSQSTEFSWAHCQQSMDRQLAHFRSNGNSSDKLERP